MTKYLDIDELAEVMAVKPETIRRYLRLHPPKVPPKMHMSGTKMLRWREHEVKSWIEDQIPQ